MKRMTILFILILIMSNLFADKYLYIKGDMIWQKMRSNPNGTKDVSQNIMDMPDPFNVKLYLAEKWKKGDSYRKFKTFYKGDFFNGGMLYGGEFPETTRIFRDGKITINFRKAYVKYVDCYVFGEQISDNINELKLKDGTNTVKYYAYYIFGNNYGNLQQCDNLSRDYKELSILKPKCIPDTIWITEVCDKTPLVSISAWTSHSQDKFSKLVSDSLDQGAYHLSNLKTSKKLIWTILGGFTAKLHLDSWALVTEAEYGYNDGPVDWKIRFLGIEKNWNKKFYLRLSPEYRYREHSYYNLEINWIDLNTFQFVSKEYRAGIFNLGANFQMEFFNYNKKNHLKIGFSQGWQQIQDRIQTGTSDIQTSFRLEPNNWYIFSSFVYQNMPSTKIPTEIDSVKIDVPLKDNLNWQGRLGRSISKWTFFVRYRNIKNRSFQNQYHDWYKYYRQDIGLGIYYRPEKILGIKNLHTELIISDSHIKEKFEDYRMNKKEELMEIKFSLFYNWKQ